MFRHLFRNLPQTMPGLIFYSQGNRAVELASLFARHWGIDRSAFLPHEPKREIKSFIFSLMQCVLSTQTWATKTTALESIDCLIRSLSATWHSAHPFRPGPCLPLAFLQTYIDPVSGDIQARWQPSHDVGIRDPTKEMHTRVIDLSEEEAKMNLVDINSLRSQEAYENIASRLSNKFFFLKNTRIIPNCWMTKKNLIEYMYGHAISYNSVNNRQR